MPYGFSLIDQRDIPERRFLGRLYRHDATGARLLTLSGDDANKVFCAAFRTPPKESTGVAHILEHSVLCGSKKYPVKEPFVELLKGSLYTFLNAMTYPDKTCYPVASTNLQDYYNLMDVYLDAVFNPRIDEWVFMQEGWHYEFDEAGRLFRKGVVYNEMKGVYSSPDSLLDETTQQRLFPDTTYGLDSGGDPRVIPNLTFEGFKAFYETYYHPANSYLFCSGDDPEDERLKRLAGYLDAYGPLTPDSAVGDQPRFEAPRSAVRPYAAEPGGKAHCTVGWLLGDTLDLRYGLCLDALEHALIGLPSSPLRKALMDSGLGEDLSGVGLEYELKNHYFATGLKGLSGWEEADARRVEGLILETLEGLATKGLDKAALDAAVNRVAFSLREANTGSFPRGLHLGLQALTTWLHDADPFIPLAFEAPLQGMEEDVAEGRLEQILKDDFVNNPHRIRVLLVPDTELDARREAEEREELAQVEQGLTEADRARIRDEADELARRQEAHDPPEALALVPRLGVADLPRENEVLPCEAREAERAQAFLYHELDTDGIVYLDLVLSLDGVQAALIPLVPSFCQALTEMGTRRQDYVGLTRRIAATTGGLSASASSLGRHDGPQTASFVCMRGKAVADKAAEMVDLMAELLTEATFDDQERFRQVLSKRKAMLERRLVPSGHVMVRSRVMARYSRAGLVGECLHGVAQLFALRSLLARVEEDWTGVREDLERLRAGLVLSGGLTLNLTCDAARARGLEPDLARLTEALPQGRPEAADLRGLATVTPPEHEGLSIPAQVNYVGKGLGVYEEGFAFHGAMNVVVKNLSRSFLWDQVRVRGGAYGAGLGLDRASGVVSFSSYRDPNLDRTLSVYNDCARHLRELALSRAELEKAVVGAVGDIDSHMLPDAKGYNSMVRVLTGDTEDLRQEMREAVLSATAEDFRSFADVLDAVAAKGSVSVIGSAKALEAAPTDVAERGGVWRLTTLL